MSGHIIITFFDIILTCQYDYIILTHLPCYHCVILVVTRYKHSYLAQLLLGLIVMNIVKSLWYFKLER